jgi:integrase
MSARGEAEPTPWLLPNGKQRKNKKGELGWRLRFKLDGYPKVEKTFYGSRSAAYREMSRLQNEQLAVAPSGLPTLPSIGWLEWLKAWVKNYAFLPDGKPRPRTTVSEHERSVKLLEPYLKKKRLASKSISKVTPADVQAAIVGFRMMNGDAGTDAARLSVTKTLRMAFSAAQTDGLIMHSPVRGDASWKPQPRPLDEPAPTPEEVFAVSTLMEKSCPSYMPRMPIVLFFSGCRVSEMLALRLEDCHLDDQTFFIKEKRSVSGGRTHYGPNKTSRSRRSVVILNEALPFVVSMYEHALEKGSDFLFCGAGKRASRKNDDGEWVTVDSPEAIGYGTLSKGWRQAVRTAHSKGLVRAPYTLHHLRHGYATWLIGDLGVAEEKVSSFLGHESVRTTNTVYRHASASSQVAAAEEISAAIEEKSAGKRTKALEAFLRTQNDPEALIKKARALDAKLKGS